MGGSAARGAATRRRPPTVRLAGEGQAVRGRATAAVPAVRVGPGATAGAPSSDPDHQRSTVMHRTIRRIGDASARRPWVTIGAWAVAAGIVMGLAGTAGGAFADDLIAPGSQSEEAMRLLEERFPQAAGGSAMAVFAAPDGERLAGPRRG